VQIDGNLQQPSDLTISHNIHNFIRIVMPNKCFTLLILLFLPTLMPAQSQTPFSNDSSAAYLRTISVDIGARPIGSPNERRAMDFALSKFREFGLQEAYLMPMREYPGSMGGAPTNTQSGIAVGVLRGKTDRIIVLGAHLDSADPDVPGANDDGSGAAVILELARVLAQRKNESTIVFTLFGGEEAGLQGSKYFVEHYPDLSRVALMLQVDMANGTPLLFPTLDAAGISSPEWLVRASYEEFKNLGLHGLHFPTDFFVFMGAMPGGGVGSDHEPFLKKGIPAIDFTSDARDPIHTPQDNYENFKIDGLKRSGDLIYRLVERYDAGVPEGKHDTYFLYQAGSYPFFIPLWALWIFVVVSLVISVIALINVRRRRTPAEGTPPSKIPGLKLFLLMLIIQTCLWLSENIVALIKGVRYPWMSDINGYYLLGFLGACVGIWLSLQLSPRLHLRRDAYSYYLRCWILLLIFVILTVLSSVKVALYPAAALFFLGLAMIVRQPVLKMLFWLLSPHFMFRLLFSETFDFLARFLHSLPEITPVINSAVGAVFVLLFSLWSFPFLLGFAALHFDTPKDLFWLSTLRNRITGIVVIVLFAITAVLLSTENSYTNEWKPAIRIEEDFSLDSASATITARSTEYLKGAKFRFDGRDTTISGSPTVVELGRLRQVPPEPWVRIDRMVQTAKQGNHLTVDLSIHVKTIHRPIQLSLSYSAVKGTLSDVASPYAFGTVGNSIMMQWGSFPDTSLTIPLTFSITTTDSTSLREHLEASFVEQPVKVDVETKLPTSVTRRSNFKHDAVVKLQ